MLSIDAVRDLDLHDFWISMQLPSFFMYLHMIEFLLELQTSGRADLCINYQEIHSSISQHAENAQIQYTHSQAG